MFKRTDNWILAVLGDLGEGCRKQGFVVGWMHSGSEGNSMIWYCNNFYITEERNKGAKTIIVKKQRSLISQERVILGHFCGLDHKMVLFFVWT